MKGSDRSWIHYLQVRCVRITNNKGNMAELEKLEEIDDILSSFEEWMHGQDAIDVSRARLLLAEVIQSISGFNDFGDN